MFHDVVKYCVSVSAKMPEGNEVHADHVACADISSILHIPYPGISKEQAEGIQFPSLPVVFHVLELLETNL